MVTPKDTEIDLHIWKKPETEAMAATYTIFSAAPPSFAITIDLPLDMALERLREYLEGLGGRGDV